MFGGTRLLLLANDQAAKQCLPSTDGDCCADSLTTVGVFPRDRFSPLAECLRRLFQHTPEPFHLILIDCGGPPQYLAEATEVIGDRPVQVIRSAGWMLPNQSRNLVMKVNRSPTLVLLENDTLVEPGWLDHLSTAVEQEDADLGLPLVHERGREGVPHFDHKVTGVREVETSSGTQLQFVTAVDRSEIAARRQITNPAEMHCMLLRRSASERIGSFDGSLTTRMDADFTLQARKLGLRTVIEPQSHVCFYPPPPVRANERDFFRWKWNGKSARRSHARIIERWNLTEMAGHISFADQFRCRATPWEYALFRLQRRLLAIWKRFLPALRSPRSHGK